MSQLGFWKGFQKMGSHPKLLYSDDEGTLQTAGRQENFKDQKIQNYRTRSCPDFVERFSRTFKDMLFKRVDADEKKGKNIQWVDYL